jgi:hypothetical protein
VDHRRQRIEQRIHAQHIGREEPTRHPRHRAGARLHHRAIGRHRMAGQPVFQRHHQRVLARAHHVRRGIGQHHEIAGLHHLCGAPRGDSCR